MTIYYDFTKPPKFVLRVFDYFRKLKLKKYKKKKIRQEITEWNKDYFVKFKIKINDPINPQISNFEYEMVVPAKAAFFAKKKVVSSIMNSVEVDFITCELMTDEEFKHYKESETEYLEEQINKKS